MHIFDIPNVWFCSMNAAFDVFGVIGQFDRSPTDRPNPSCSLNLKRQNYEADLLIWELGDAELMIGKVDGLVTQMHFDNLRNQTELLAVLSKLIEFAVLTRST